MPMETRSTQMQSQSQEKKRQSQSQMQESSQADAQVSTTTTTTTIRKRQKSLNKKDGAAARGRTRSRSRSASKSPSRAAVTQLNRKHKVYTKKELNAIKNSAGSAAGADAESLSDLVSKIDADSQMRTAEAASSGDVDGAQPRRRSTRSASNKVDSVPVVKLTDALKDKDLSDSPAIIIDSSSNRYQLRNAVRNSPFVARVAEEDTARIRNSTPQLRLSASPKKEAAKSEDNLAPEAIVVKSNECWFNKYFYSGYLRYSYAEVALFVFVTFVAIFGLVSLAGLVNVASPLEVFKEQIQWVSKNLSESTRALFHTISDTFSNSMDKLKAFFNRS